MLAEMLERLVEREPGRVGRDLEEDPARLAIVDGVEVRASITGDTLYPSSTNRFRHASC
jgi:hypothetical protein